MIKKLFVFFLFLGFAFGKERRQWDIQGLLYEKYQQSLSDDRFSELAKDRGFVDLYKETYSYLKDSLAQSYRASIDRFLEKLEEKNCGVSEKDLELVLKYIDFGDYSKIVILGEKVCSSSKEELNKFLDNPFSYNLPCKEIARKDYTKKIIGVCNKIVHCFTGGSYRAGGDIVKECVSIIYPYLNLYTDSQVLLDQMKLQNWGDDILLNGKTGDGPYDLLKDIEEIKKILFEEKAFKSSPKISFYSSNKEKNSNLKPSFLIPSAGREEGSVDNLPPDQRSYNPNPNVLPPDVISNLPPDQIENIVSNIVETTENKNSTNNITKKVSSFSENGIINNENCFNQADDFDKFLIGTQENADNQLSSNIASGMQEDNENKLYEKILFNSLDTGDTLRGQEKTEFFSQALNVIYKNGSLEKEDLWSSKSSPICGNFSKGGMVGVNICLIPSGIKVPPKDRVFSIEDILNQLLRILALLKDSGQLQKNAYADEFWETRLQDIKLYRIFVFDIVIMKKRLFSEEYTKKENPEQAKQNEKEKFKDMEYLAGLLYSDNLAADKLERNKYVVLGNSRRLYWKHPYLGSMAQANILTQEENTYNIQNILYQFVKANLEGWNQIDLMLLNFRKTARYFYAEIKVGVDKSK